MTVALALVVSLSSPAFAVSKYKVLHHFGAGQDSNTPSGPLTLGEKGRLYGLTYGGGPQNSGSVYQLAPGSGGKWAEKILHAFAGGSDGGIPWGGVIVDSAGSLYGTVQGDGNREVGGVFELHRGSGGWNNVILYSNNAGPGVVLDKLGNLYGEVGPGNYFHIGAIGELSPGSDGWVYTDLANFNPRSVIHPRLRRSGTAKAICLAPPLTAESVSQPAGPATVAESFSR